MAGITSYYGRVTFFFADGGSTNITYKGIKERKKLILLIMGGYDITYYHIAPTAYCNRSALNFKRFRS